GTATVTWTITDLCETINVSADFNLTAPTAVTYDAPVNDASTAAEFDDPDANVAQANLDADIAAWVAAQTDAITNSIAGGCSPKITNDFVGQSISFCTTASLTITWTVQDLCETTNPTATYTFTQPDGISFTNPTGKVVNSCDFSVNDPIAGQNALDADIAAWVAAQTDVITNSLTGGSPDVAHDFVGQSIDLCAGGNITVTWTIDDICETINTTATYTVTPSDPIAYIAPTNLDAQSCDFADQAEVDTAFNNWVAAQSTAIGQTGGCSPVLSNDSASVSIPELCTGGTATVTWTITDLCETINLSADFNLTAPVTTTFTNPVNDTSEACEFGTDDLVSAQQNLDADISAWVNAQTTNISSSFADGCNPVVSNDFTNQTIDFCTGGSITVTWTVTDLCDTINVSATYTFTQPDAAVFDQNTLPADITVECDAIPDAAALTASNSCGNISVSYNETRTDGDCLSTYILERTWSATNICGVTTVHVQTINVQDTTPPVLDLPANVTAECSDDLTPIAFGEATATDNCDANPVITFVDVITNGACPGDNTITRTWTATDACGNVASADQTISTSDTTAPVFDQTNLPADVVVECTTIPDAVVLTATDNCGSAVVTVEDVRTNGNCPGNYVVTRTYTATDECGLTNTHVQTITVQDTTPPVFVEDLPIARLVVECDAIPVPETLTATDSCGSATVSVSDTRTNGDCPNNYTLARTWTATDECGLTTTFTQIITVQDTTPPVFVESLPVDITVECDAIPDVITLTATDNCGTADVTVSDNRTDGSCPNSYFIARTWTATDECGLNTTHTQIITVEDTTAPVPVTNYDQVINVSCLDLEDAPELEFTDNCSSNVIVEFEETNTYEVDVFEDYQIIRTWTVRDACNNEAAYTQTVNVTLDENYYQINENDRCFDDGLVNLRNFLSDDASTGSWEIIEGNPLATITGDIFDPTDLESAYTEEFNPNTEGITYVLRYRGFENGCINITDVTMVVDAKCKVLPCGESDIIISKAITPNGDGYNDTFDIAGIDLCGFTAEIKIFNRWGALVYESDNYTLGSIKTSGSKGDWDGTSPKSSVGSAGKLPNGTYYYIINLRDSGLSPLTGPIYLGTK
ncbi:gliding motility-associated C-terminal domain-containing protein, partial [Flavobacteriaceae bacterium SZ-1-7]|uniref:gliding motility-associated C-terminal domain-containing protein n=1 Tax=Tamlana sedimenti TaxID=3134126 RepID=UPI003125A578